MSNIAIGTDAGNNKNTRWKGNIKHNFSSLEVGFFLGVNSCYLSYFQSDYLYFLDDPYQGGVPMTEE